MSRYPKRIKEPIPRMAWSMKEVAEAVGCSEKHIKSLCAQGVIPSLKLGERRLIRNEDLQMILSSKQAD